MKTVTTVKVKAETDHLQFGYWDMNSESFVPISGMTQTELDEAAKLCGCTPILLDALVIFADSIREAVTADLVDIWKRAELN